MTHIDFKKKSTHFTDAIKTTLGSNLYAIERPNKPASKDKPSKAAETKDKPSKQQEAKKLDLNPEAAKRELNMLAALLKGSEKQDAKEVLDINLFPEPIKKSGGAGGAQAAEEDYAADVIVFETTSTQQKERIKNLVGDWGKI